MVRKIRLMMRIVSKQQGVAGVDVGWLQEEVVRAEEGCEQAARLRAQLVECHKRLATLTDKWRREKAREGEAEDRCAAAKQALDYMSKRAHAADARCRDLQVSAHPPLLPSLPALFLMSGFVALWHRCMASCHVGCGDDCMQEP